MLTKKRLVILSMCSLLIVFLLEISIGTIPDPAFYASMDGPAGTIVNKFGQNISSGAQIIEGLWGYARNFSSQPITLPTAINGAFTMSVWLKPSGFGTDFGQAYSSTPKTSGQNCDSHTWNLAYTEIKSSGIKLSQNSIILFGHTNTITTSVIESWTTSSQECGTQCVDWYTPCSACSTPITSAQYCRWNPGPTARYCITSGSPAGSCSDLCCYNADNPSKPPGCYGIGCCYTATGTCPSGTYRAYSYRVSPSGGGCAVCCDSGYQLSGYAYPDYGNQVCTDWDEVCETVYTPHSCTRNSPAHYSTTANYLERSRSASFSMNSWNHLVIRFDGNNFKAYLNGADLGSVSTGFGFMQISDILRNYNGLVDDLAVWNYALSDSQLLELANYDESLYWVQPLDTQNNGSEATHLTSFTASAITSVPDFVWHNEAIGKIKFLQAMNLSCTTNLNRVFKLGRKLAFINTSIASCINNSANITFEGIDCTDPKARRVYYSDSKSTLDDILFEQRECLPPRCINKICKGEVNGNLTFTVPHFSGFAAGANSNLTIYDEIEYSGTKETGKPIMFYANYTNSTGHITGAVCNITFDDNPGTVFSMAEGISNYYYNKTSGFASGGLHSWNVSCDHPNFSDLSTNDTIQIQGTASVPEFSHITLMLAICVCAVIGTIILKNKKYQKYQAK